MSDIENIKYDEMCKVWLDRDEKELEKKFPYLYDISNSITIVSGESEQSENIEIDSDNDDINESFIYAFIGGTDRVIYQEDQEFGELFEPFERRPTIRYS